MYRRPLAFLKRDFITASSYKLSFAMQIIGMIMSVLMFFFISRLFGETARPMLSEYGGDYFSFVLIGIAFSGYLGAGMSSFSAGIAQEQSLGTLEAMLVTPAKLSTIVLSMSIWNFLLTSINVIFYLLVGVIFFNVNISNINIPAAFAAQILTIVCFASLGIMSASFIMVLKRGDPINWLFGGISSLVGGVYYPVQVLPKGLTYISYALPITYALRAVRLAVLKGYTIYDLRLELGMLLVFTLVFMPVSMVMFRYAVRKARTDGSLMHF
ncbi:MAG: ABC transporter permease [Armatimonadota bacterium]